jgi:hypothetical protein
MMLTTLTLMLIAIVVIGLVTHLAAVAWALVHARHSVTRIADALETVARQTGPLEAKLVTTNGALSALATGLDTADRHLGRAARVFRL